MCKNTVCFLQTVPWSTRKTTYNSIPLCEATDYIIVKTKDAACVAREHVAQVAVKQVIITQEIFEIHTLSSTLTIE